MSIKSSLDHPESFDRWLKNELIEINLVYRKQVPWAVGHGVAVDWEVNERAIPTKINTEFIPFHEVKDFSTELDTAKYLDLNDEILSIARIADEAIPNKYIALFIFGLSLAFILHNYGNIPLAQAEILLSKPGALIGISALVYYVLTRVFYYFRNKSLDDAVFYAQIEHYKERYYREKAEKEQLDSKSEI